MLFTTKQITANEKSPVLFIEKGNKEGMPSEVSDLSIYAIRQYFSPTYDQFSNNLQHYIAATQEQSLLVFSSLCS